MVKVNVYLTKMENFAAMNGVYDGFFNKEPKPVRTCVAVFQLPLGTGESWVGWERVWADG